MNFWKLSFYLVLCLTYNKSISNRRTRTHTSHELFGCFWTFKQNPVIMLIVLTIALRNPVLFDTPKINYIFILSFSTRWPSCVHLPLHCIPTSRGGSEFELEPQVTLVRSLVEVWQVTTREKASEERRMIN